MSIIKRHKQQIKRNKRQTYSLGREDGFDFVNSSSN